MMMLLMIMIRRRSRGEDDWVRRSTVERPMIRMRA